MAIQFSKILKTRSNDQGGFSTKSVDLSGLGEGSSPVVVLDDFRVSGQPFGPHPHAGFSTITYVLENSQGALRSRDSLGNDIIMGPGGIIWTQAGSGMLHHELPAEEGRELHGLQIFVNLSRKNKGVKPQVFPLKKDEIPEWKNQTGDRVRVVVGHYQDLSSPLSPIEPFNLLDVVLTGEVDFHLPKDHNAIFYALEGEAVIGSDGAGQRILGGQALAANGTEGSGKVSLQARGSARLVILSGAAIHEPVLAHGPFIMNDQSQILDAMQRYQTGRMGYLDPS